jgi:hypothetical protein
LSLDKADLGHSLPELGDHPRRLCRRPAREKADHAHRRLLRARRAGRRKSGATNQGEEIAALDHEILRFQTPCVMAPVGAG